MLQFQAPFSLVDWLQQAPPYDNENRDANYFDALENGQNYNLVQALRESFNRFDGDDDADYIEECYRNYHESRAHQDELAVLYRIRDRDTQMNLAKTTILNNPQHLNMALIESRDILVANLHTYLQAPNILVSLHNDPFIGAIYNSVNSTQANRNEIDRMLDEFSQNQDVVDATVRLNQYFNAVMQQLSQHGQFQGDQPDLAILHKEFYEELFSQPNSVSAYNAFMQVVGNAPYNWDITPGDDIGQIQTIFNDSLQAVPPADEDVTTLRNLVYEVMDELVEEHPIINNFYGQECHRLWSSYGIYRIDGRHKLDKNMAWALGNIHGERNFLLRPDLDMSSFMRQTVGHTSEPSAFANEVAALMIAQYHLVKVNGAYQLHSPPNPMQTNLDDIQHDMENVYHRINVLDKCSQLVSMKVALLQEERQAEFDVLEQRYHRVQDHGPVDLNTVIQRINQQEQQLLNAYQPHGANSLQDIRVYLQQFHHLTQDQTSQLEHIQRIELDRPVIAAIQAKDIEIQNTQNVQGNIQTQVDTLLLQHNQVGNNISDFTQRFQQLQTDYQLVANPIEGENPPDLAAQLQNVNALRNDINQVDGNLQVLNLNHVNTDIVNNLLQNVGQLRASIIGMQMQNQLQNLQDNQEIPGNDIENNPDDDNQQNLDL